MSKELDNASFIVSIFQLGLKIYKQAYYICL